MLASRILRSISPKVPIRSNKCPEKHRPAFSKAEVFKSHVANFTTQARYGQPHWTTHPHLLKEGELAVGFKKEEFAERRQLLVDLLEPGAVAVFPATMHYMMTNDIPYNYRPNSDLYYLTGFSEPECLAVLKRHPQTGKAHFTFFVRPRNPMKEIWDGPRTGVERASEFGADEAYSVQDLAHVLPRLLEGADTIYYNDIMSDANAVEVLQNYAGILKSAQPLVESLRLTKSPAEIEMMKKSCSISARSVIEVMKATRPGISQQEINARMEFECRMRGSFRLAYPPVVASGVNNLTLHYIDNDEIVKDGELILLDVGGEYYNFASDITRTYPANGKFTEAQLDIYNAVLGVNKKIIELAKPEINGQKMTLNVLHRLSAQMLSSELIRLGILPKSNANQYHQFYPHSIGHWLGMDVHDVSSISSDTHLRPGMIITVEPGLYIPNIDTVPEKYRGIGIRIEDDVLITEGDAVVLTHEVPKEAHEIEAVMQSSK